MKRKLNISGIIENLILIAVVSLVVVGLLLAGSTTDNGTIDGVNLAGIAMVVAGICLWRAAQRKGWVEIQESDRA